MFNIISKRRYTYVFSALVVAVSIFALLSWGLKLGIDFKGGTLMEVEFSQNTPSVEEMRGALDPVGVESLIVQPSDNNRVLLRYIASDEEQNQGVLSALKSFDENVVQHNVDFVGATISDQLRSNAVTAIAVAIIVITLYIAWAFRKVSFPVPSWHYGIGAIIALVHDVLIVLGIFAFLGVFFNVEIGIPFVAALLTILGYSVNDTIVIYDRIRENLLHTKNFDDFESLVNKSLNESLARSVNTSGTLIVVLIAIIFFGGGALTWFAAALLIGVISGTYSSIFVATALLVTSHKRKQKIKNT